MKFKVNHIGGKYQELAVDEIHTGTLNAIEATELARDLVDAADELLHGAELESISDICTRASEAITNHLDDIRRERRMNNPIDSIVMCNDRLPAKSGVYKIKNNSGCNNGDGEVYYSVDTGWDIPESIRSFYKVLGWVE